MTGCLFLEFKYWKSPDALGMKNLSRVEFVVQEKHFQLVVQQLPLRLTEFLPNLPSDEKEESFFTSVLVAEAAASAKQKYHSDLRLYMEAKQKYH